MNIIEIIFGSTILDVVIRAMILCVGALIGIVVSTLMVPPTQVLRISEKDGRGWELNVNEETTRFLETKSSPPLRFLKWGRSYEFTLGWMKKKVTRFLGKEGTAYSWKIFGFDNIPVPCQEDEAEDHLEEKVPIINPDTGNIVMLDGEPAYELKLTPVKYERQIAELEFENLAEVLEWKWGTKFYSTIPQKRKDELLDNQVNLSVELQDGLTPKGYTPITEQDINDEGDRNFLRILALEAKGAINIPYVQYIFIMATGGLLILGAAILLGYIPVGT